ncbi:hypothetical protein V8E55_008850 [Tylopilus felleus]
MALGCLFPANKSPWCVRLKGLQTDLGLSVRYSSGNPVWIPSNMLLKPAQGSELCIETHFLYWHLCRPVGLDERSHRLTHNFAGIMACRVFIGLPELSDLLSFKFTPASSSPTHLAAYVWAAGILANMNGTLGVAAWKWRNNGAHWIPVHVATARLLYFGRAPEPHNTRWLSPAERHSAQGRLAEDAGEATRTLNKNRSDFQAHVRFSIVGTQFRQLLPDVVTHVLREWLAATFGYSMTITLLMTTPPWVFSARSSMLNMLRGVYTDVTGKRFFHQTGWWWVIMIGYIISLRTMKTAGRYFSMFLMTTGYCGMVYTKVGIGGQYSPSSTSQTFHRKRARERVLKLGKLAGFYIWKTNWGRLSSIDNHCALCARVCEFMDRSESGLGKRPSWKGLIAAASPTKLTDALVP